MGLTTQVGKECKKLFISVRRMNQAGNKVVLDEDECYIENKKTGKRTAIYEHEGTFAFDIWVRIQEKSEYTGIYSAIKEEEDEEESSGFVGLDDPLF